MKNIDRLQPMSKDAIAAEKRKLPFGATKIFMRKNRSKGRNATASACMICFAEKSSVISFGIGFLDMKFTSGSV
ncbi:MAG: hypothetical protein E7332_02675 [Clostridiales bacterium]|nr:hypothetical protein [Clostridiales bacterium]